MKVNTGKFLKNLKVTDTEITEFNQHKNLRFDAQEPILI